MTCDVVIKVIILTWLLIDASAGTSTECDWKEVERSVYIPYDIDNTPLVIRTDSAVGSNEQVIVWFYSPQGEPAGGIYLQFTSPPQYVIHSCTSWTPLPTQLPAQQDKVWNITKTVEPRTVVVTCNNVEVLNFLVSDSTCDNSYWNKDWSRGVTQIQFYSYDTASDYYSSSCSSVNPEGCTSTNRGLVLSEGKAVSIDFILPDGSNLVNITRDGNDVTALFIKNSDNTDVYSFTKSSVEEGDAGVYEMFHETQGHTGQCFSVLIIAKPLEAVKATIYETIKAQLVFGPNTYDGIKELLPDLNEEMKSATYTSYQNNIAYDVLKVIALDVEVVAGKTVVSLKAVTTALNADTVGILLYNETSGVNVVDISFPITLSTTCEVRMKRCNGVVECQDMSDEKGCSIAGVYSRMALTSSTMLMIPSPPNDNTMCLYTFASGARVLTQPVKTEGYESNSEPSEVIIPTAGFHCLVLEKKKIKLYSYEKTANFKLQEGPTSRPVSALQYWVLEAKVTIKNIIVYDKVLSTAEMKNYLSRCGQIGYPATADLYLDHHSIIVVNRVLRQATLEWDSTQDPYESEANYEPETNYESETNYEPETNYESYDSQSDSGPGDILYVVLTSMCEETAVPSGAVNLVNTYICDTGRTIPYHCADSGAVCVSENEEECEYFNSQIVALTDTAKSGNSDTCTRAEVRNKYNNMLGRTAISAANTFLDCSKDSCTKKAYLADHLLEGEIDLWAGSGTTMQYNNWTTKPTERGTKPVVLGSGGGWTLDASLPRQSRLLCNVGGESSATSKNVKFDGTNYSQLKIAKTEVFNKLTMCWAATGSGVLLHYAGAYSITGRDIYVTSDVHDGHNYLTIYIGGFPEYFDIVDASNSYICIRWEKVTGRIDLAVNGGHWIVGQNTYASNRRINLPKSGKLIVGAEIDTKTKQVGAKKGRWNGILLNLVIWNTFFNPLILQETANQGICTTSRTKMMGWLTFEEIIAGMIDHEMYSDDSICEINKKRKRFVDDSGPVVDRRPRRTITDVDDDRIYAVAVDYEAYTLASSTTLSSWLKTTQSGITVGITSEYSVRKHGDMGNLKLEALSSLCLTGITDSAGGYYFTISVYSTGITTLQVGLTSRTVTAGSPATVSFDNVYPLSGKICITNVLSPSDYAPLDGYIESIRYASSGSSSPICPSEEEDLGEKGKVVWPTVWDSRIVTTICQYGRKDDYTKIGFARRECVIGEEEGSWAKITNSSDCAVKYSIDISKIDDYFEDTVVTDANVEEFAETINQVVQVDDNKTITETQLDTTVAALDKLSKTVDVKISDTTMQSVVEVANTINTNSDKQSMRKQEEEKQTATKIVKSVAALAAKVDLVPGTVFVSRTTTVSVAAYKPPELEPGKTTSNDIVAHFKEGDKGTDIDINSEDIAGSDIKKTSVITIGKDKVNEGENVWFTSYKGDSPLFASDTKFILDGQIIGAGIGKTEKQFTDETGVLMTFYTDDNVRDQNAYCQFWEYMVETTPAGWSSDGMTLVNKTDTTVTCKASHLTNFAILINPSNTVFTGAEELTLQIITIGGCIMSIIGLLATIIGLAVFKQIRSVLTNKVHIGLSVSLLIAYIFLLIGPDRTEDEGVCYFFSVAIHFSFLCAFCWMLCEAVNLYLRLVVVFDSYSKMFLKFTIFSIVVPIVIVTITVVIEFVGEKGAYIIENAASAQRVYCWLDYKARMAAFMLPLILILCANFVVFILVMRVLFASKKIATAANNKTQWLARLRSAVAVSTLVGLSWILGFFAIGEASFVFNVVFALCNSLQGVLICYLYCFAKNDVVTKWKSSLQTSLKSSRDKTGISTSSSAAHPPFRSNVNNTKSASIPMSSKGAVSLSASPRPDNKYNNVYANEASVSVKGVPDKPAADPIYVDLPQSDHDDEDHIYEDFVPAMSPGPSLVKRRVDHLPEEDKGTRKIVTLSKHLQALVKEKVETFEGIIQGADVVICQPDTDQAKKDVNDTWPDTNTSFQIKSESGTSYDSKSPFNL